MPNDTSLRSLITRAAADAVTLFRAQTELAKAEFKQDGDRIAKTSVLFIMAGTLAFLGLIFVLVTIAYVLVQIGLPTWAGFGIVALFLIIVAAVLGIVGKTTADKIKGPKLTMQEIEKTKQQFLPQES